MTNLADIKRNIKKALGYYHQRVIILMYHRVLDVPTSPYHGIVSTEHFEQQMAYLRQTCDLISLPDLVDAIREKSLPQKGVVVTFDDGYADNYNHAYPILRKYNVPATIFITSDYIGSKKEYWWDELERIFLLPEKLPEKVNLSFSGKELELNLNTLSQEQRRIHLRAFHAFLKPLKPKHREVILNALRNAVGLQEHGREDYLPMSKEEFLQLSSDPLIHIGTHTKTHPMLSALSFAEQREEILGSKRELEKIINRPVNHCAYPYGTSADFNAETVQIINQDLSAAVTTIPGIVTGSNDLALLPRIWIGDWGIEKFKQMIEMQLI